MISPHIDQKIKNVFGLFKDPNKNDQDQRIYAEIYGYIHDEMIRFVEDNISDEEMKDLGERITAIEKKEEESIDRFSQVYPLIIRSLMNIPNCEYRLYKRLDYFVSNLFIDSIKNKPQRNNKDESNRS